MFVLTIAVVLIASSPAFGLDSAPTKELTATEYASAKQQQSLRVHLTTSKSEYLRREWIFVRYWIENEGTTSAYFHWEDIPEVALIGPDSTAIPSCWPNEGSVFYDRHGTRRPDGEIALQYIEIQPQAKSQFQLRRSRTCTVSAEATTAKLSTPGSFAYLYLEFQVTH